MMRAETAERSFSRLESFLRQSMASIRKGSRSLRTRSASVRVKRRWGGSGVSSCSGSSSSSAMAVRWSRSLASSTTAGKIAAKSRDFCAGGRVGRSMLRRHLMLAQRERAVEGQTGEIAGAFVDGDAIDDVAGTQVFEGPEKMLRSDAEHGGADADVG